MTSTSRHQHHTSGGTLNSLRSSSPIRLMTFDDTGVPVFNDIAFIDVDMAFGAPRVQLGNEAPVLVLAAPLLAVTTFMAFGAPRVQLGDEAPVVDNVLAVAPLAVMTFNDMAVLVFVAFMAFEKGVTRVQLGTEAPMEALVAALAAPPTRFGDVTIETTGGVERSSLPILGPYSNRTLIETA